MVTDKELNERFARVFSRFQTVAAQAPGMDDVALRAQGLTYQAIAKQKGISPTRVRRRYLAWVEKSPAQVFGRGLPPELTRLAREEERQEWLHHERRALAPRLQAAPGEFRALLDQLMGCCTFTSSHACPTCYTRFRAMAELDRVLALDVCRYFWRRSGLRPYW